MAKGRKRGTRKIYWWEKDESVQKWLSRFSKIQEDLLTDL